MEPEFVGMMALGGIVLAILLINDRQKERLVRRAEKQGRKPNRAHLNYKTQGRAIFVVLFSTVVMALVLSNQSTETSPENTPREPRSLTMPIVILTVIIGVCLLGVTIAAWKNRHRRCAKRLAQAGNLDGAAEVLERLLQESKPSALLLNDLAVVRGMQNQWDETLRLLETAAGYRDWRPFMLTTKGMAYWKLGRPTEALPCLETAARQNPKDLVATCNYGTLLVELQRHDEALQLLRKADQLFSTEPSTAG